MQQNSSLESEKKKTKSVKNEQFFWTLNYVDLKNFIQQMSITFILNLRHVISFFNHKYK